MKLTVEIVRNVTGVLSAYVVQQGKRGRNLLNGRMLTSVNSVRLQIPGTLQSQLGCPVEIEWIGEQPEQPKSVADRPVQGPRDRYGWKSL